VTLEKVLYQRVLLQATPCVNHAAKVLLIVTRMTRVPVKRVLHVLLEWEQLLRALLPATLSVKPVTMARHTVMWMIRAVATRALHAP
jgi:hypothetical protein